MKRQFDPAEPELMDRPQPVSLALQRDLQNLRHLNYFFGGYGLVRRFLQRWIKPSPVRPWRIADLATGSGDIPRLAVDYARSLGAPLAIDALDQQAATLEIARRLSVGYPEITYAQANVLEWQTANLYDIVLCSLTLHHFSEEDAVRLLQRARSLSTKFVLISDLRRTVLAKAGIYLLTALVFREPMTRYDARVSVARAFSFEELGRLARRAGWKNFRLGKFPFARQAVWLE